MNLITVIFPVFTFNYDGIPPEAGEEDYSDLAKKDNH